LEHGNIATVNAAPAWLGRHPTAMQDALILPQWVQLPLWMRHGLQAALALMWIYTAVTTALWPHQSQVLSLLARCGFEGDWGWRMMVMSCTLNTAMGLALLRSRPGAWAFALQAGATMGYTAMAAWHVPELTIDHCGPLVKNVPVLMMVMFLWITVPMNAADDAWHARRVLALSALTGRGLQGAAAGADSAAT
ncbi:MAG: hypothetical protein EOP38_27645, partial [Rubrivivax sp.]